MSVLLAAEYATAADLVRATTLIDETAHEVVETYSPHHIEELAPPRRAPVALLSGRRASAVRSPPTPASG
jgi:hypothetical protein